MIARLHLICCSDCPMNQDHLYVHLIDAPIAAAIGIGLDIRKSEANCIVVLGAGTTDVGVIAQSNIVAGGSLRYGGNQLNSDIVKYFKRNHNLHIGLSTAERVKCDIGSATDIDPELTCEIRGRDLVSGLPKTRLIESEDIREALRDTLSRIEMLVIDCIERTPPEYGSDLLDRGITLTGGGAILKNIEVLIRRQIDIPTVVAEDPVEATIRGIGIIADGLNHYAPVLK